MSVILEFSESTFKIGMIKLLRPIMDRVDSMEEQMGSVNREMGIIRNNLNQNQKLENTVAKVKNAFNQ